MANVMHYASKLAKGVISLNLATIIRASFGGIEQGKQTLKDSYDAVALRGPVLPGDALKWYSQIPSATLTSLGAVQSEVNLDLRYANVDGSTPLEDLIAILSLAKAQNPVAVLEFGTYFGSTTANLARNLPHATINTIDLPEASSTASAAIEGRPVDDLHLIQGRQLGKAFRETELEQRIVQHYGDTALYDYSVIPGPVSFFMIDGSHTYEYAKNDTIRSLEIAQGDCTIVWHDCDHYHPGVVKWLAELRGSGFPVVRIGKTRVACLRMNAQDPRWKNFLLLPQKYDA